VLNNHLIVTLTAHKKCILNFKTNVPNFFRYIAILLAVSAVVLAAKKERDEYQQRPSGGCPCADTYGRGDLQDGEPCGRKERKAFEKMQEKKFKPRRAYEGKFLLNGNIWRCFIL